MTDKFDYIKIKNFSLSHGIILQVERPSYRMIENIWKRCNFKICKEYLQIKCKKAETKIQNEQKTCINRQFTKSESNGQWTCGKVFHHYHQRNENQTPINPLTELSGNGCYSRYCFTEFAVNLVCRFKWKYISSNC